MVSADPKRRIFLRQARQGHAHLFLIGLGFGLHGNLDHRIGEFHALQNDRLDGITERVTGGGVLQTGNRDNIAGIGGIDVFAAVGVHQQHTADALALALDRVQNRRALGQGAGIDAHERQ